MELRSQMKLASKMRQYISTLPVVLSFMKFCVARTCFCQTYLDVVLEFLQVHRWLDQDYFLMKLVDIYYRKIRLKIRMVALLMTEIFNFTTIEEKTISRSLSYKNFIKDKICLFEKIVGSTFLFYL